MKKLSKKKEISNTNKELTRLISKKAEEEEGGGGEGGERGKEALTSKVREAAARAASASVSWLMFLVE